MAQPAETYIHCDELEKLPKDNRDNWEYELSLVCGLLPEAATVLQVGCMDGTRIRRLLSSRHDLRITGLDIEEDLLTIARKKCPDAEFVLGDITAPPPLPRFGSVLCLNNTIGYIPLWQKALANMRALGNTVVVSVYGERFTDAHAQAYFAALGLTVEHIENDTIRLGGFTDVKRFTRKEVEAWGGTTAETPLGYCCTMRA